MKNLLIYTGPNKKFDEETALLAKIQIDNSLELGWKKEDLMFVTDFPFEYNGVKSLVIKDGIYSPFDLAASKIAVIVYLLNQNLIEPRQLYWCHDFDAYQNEAFSEAELGLEKFDLGLIPYSYKPEWQCASFFFKASAKDIFQLLDQTIWAKPHSSRNNEKTLTKLIKVNAIDSKRYKKLNVTYSVGKRCLATIYNQALRPLRVLHFHPKDKDSMMSDTALNMFMYGKNSLKKPLMSDRLIKIFTAHGII